MSADPVVYPKKCMSMFVMNILFVKYLEYIEEEKSFPIFVRLEWATAKKDFDSAWKKLYGPNGDIKKIKFDDFDRKLAFRLADAALRISDAAWSAANKNPDHPYVAELKTWQNDAATTIIDFYPGFQLPVGTVPDEFWARAKELREQMLSIVNWVDCTT